MLSVKDRVQKNEKIPWRLIEDEAVLVNIENDEVIHLNEVAAEVWSAIDGTKTISQIIDQIYEKFEVEKEAAEQDVLDCLNQLLEKKVARL